MANKTKDTDFTYNPQRKDDKAKSFSTPIPIRPSRT